MSVSEEDIKRVVDEGASAIGCSVNANGWCKLDFWGGGEVIFSAEMPREAAMAIAESIISRYALLDADLLGPTQGTA